MALPPIVFRTILRTITTDKERARAELLAAVLFVGCRSCEYSVVPRKEQKTRPLRIQDVEFKIGARTILHNSTELHRAQVVIIKFGPQKTGVYSDEIPIYRNNDKELNPVRLWAKVISRLRSHPKHRESWPVFTYFDKQSGRRNNIKSSEILQDIRTAVEVVGQDVLGFGPKAVGTHSVRASLAMMLYLQKVPPYTIMLVGRWRSDAFLSYIEKQCNEFTKELSSIMLGLETFYQLPQAFHHRDLTQTRPENPNHPPNAPKSSRRAHFIHYGRRNALRSHASA